MGFREEWKWGESRIRRDDLDRGYWLEGELQLGFPDNPELSPRERLTIARWAEAFSPGPLSPEQERLLSEAPRPPTFLPIQAGFAQNQLDLQAPSMSELYDSLSDEEKEIVRDPSCSSPSEGLLPLDRGRLGCPHRGDAAHGSRLGWGRPPPVLPRGRRPALLQRRSDPSVRPAGSVWPQQGRPRRGGPRQGGLAQKERGTAFPRSPSWPMI